MNGNIDRRDLVKALGYGGLTAIGVSIAGCTGDSSSSGDESSNGGGETGGDDTESSGGDSGEEWTDTDTIEMTDELKFAPDHATVSAGTTVTWENVGAVGHTVTAYEDELPDGAAYFASGGFDSEEAAKDGYPDEGNVTEGNSFEHTFETPGTYKYYCIPHEMNGMVGFIKVN